MNRQSYLEILCGQIRCKRALPLVTQEIEAHIEDQKSDFMAEGMNSREAEEAAVREMGDPVEVGVEMDRIHRPRMNRRMIAGLLLANLLGMAILRYMDVRISGKDALFLYDPLRYLILAAGGFALMLIVCYIDYTRIARLAKPLLVGYALFLFLGVNVFSGGTVNGRTVFLAGRAALDPEQLSLLFVPLLGAVVYSCRKIGYRGLLRAAGWMVFVCLTMLFLGCGAGILFFLPVFAVLLTAAVCKGYFRVRKGRVLAAVWGVTCISPFAALAFYYCFGYAYQQERVRLLMDPGRYAGEAGYPFFMLRRMLAGSRLIGTASGFSDISGNIPESSRYALAYIAAYFGIIAAAAAAAVLLLLFFRLTRDVLRQRNRLGVLMGAGCGAVLLEQTVWYVLINLGVTVIPQGAEYCPFLMCGGTGIFITDILIGIMLSIYRYQSVSEEPAAGKEAMERKRREKMFS